MFPMILSRQALPSSIALRRVVAQKSLSSLSFLSTLATEAPRVSYNKKSEKSMSSGTTIIMLPRISAPSSSFRFSQCIAARCFSIHQTAPRQQSSSSSTSDKNADSNSTIEHENGEGGNKQYMFNKRENPHRQSALHHIFRHPSAVGFRDSGILTQAQESSLSTSPASESFQLLEIGCGSGWSTQDTARLLPPSARITAADANNGLIQEALKRVRDFPSEHDQKITFVCRRGEEVQEEYANQFDAVWIRCVTVHVPDPVAFLRSAVACLKPNGILFVEEMDTIGECADPDLLANDVVHEAARQICRKLGGELRGGYKMGGYMKKIGMKEIHCKSYVPLFGKGLTIPPWLGVDETPLGKWPSQEKLYNLGLSLLGQSFEMLEPKMEEWTDFTTEDIKRAHKSMETVNNEDYLVFVIMGAKAMQWWAKKP